MSHAWEAFCTRLFDQNKFAIKLGLENIAKALVREGHPELSHRRIVVGGTNGKGSTAALIANLLQAEGLKVGLYTSPHLIELRERFRVNGVPLPRAQVLDFGARILERYAQPHSDPQLTFFEITTLVAAMLFERAGVDVAVYEVGLGGRLDAVNAIAPDLTVITAIALDHTRYLGDSVGSIAGEKAGLLRADTPAVIAPQVHSDAAQVLREKSDTIVWAEADCRFSGIRADHVGTALKAVTVFLGRSPEGADSTIRNTLWPGRQHVLTAQVEGSDVRFVLDAAHNPAGMASFAEFMRDRGPKVGAFVVGAMADKDLEGLFAPIQTWDVPRFAYPLNSQRAASPEVLADVCGAVESANVADAIRRAVEAAGGESVAVCGSIYLLGEVFSLLGFGPDDLRISREDV